MAGTVAVALICAGPTCQPDTGYSEDHVFAWELRDSQTAGNCQFLLTQAHLSHAVEWEGGIEMLVSNVGLKSARCSWKATIIDGSGAAVSTPEGAVNTIAAGQSTTRYVQLHSHFSADATRHGGWIHLHIADGWLATFTGPGEDFNVVDPTLEARF